MHPGTSKIKFMLILSELHHENKGVLYNSTWSTVSVPWWKHWKTGFFHLYLFEVLNNSVGYLSEEICNNQNFWVLNPSESGVTHTSECRMKLQISAAHRSLYSAQFVMICKIPTPLTLVVYLGNEQNDHATRLCAKKEAQSKSPTKNIIKIKLWARSLYL